MLSASRKKEIRLEIQNIMTIHDISECDGCELCDKVKDFGYVLFETTDDKYILKKEGKYVGGFSSKLKVARKIKKSVDFVQELIDGFNLEGYTIDVDKNANRSEYSKRK